MLRTAVVLSLVAAVFASSLLLAEEAKSPEEILAAADGAFSRKTYKEAIEGYEAYLKTAPAPEKAFHAKFRIAESQFGLNQVWPALKRLEELRPETAEGSLERARVDALLGGKRAEVRGGSKETVAILDEAAAIYAQKDLVAERVEVLFSLARALAHSWDYGLDFQEWQDRYWNADPEKIEVTWDDYRKKRMVEQDEWRYARVVATYEEILKATGDDSAKSLALYELGSFHVNVLARAFRQGANYYGDLPSSEMTEEQKKVLDRFTGEVGKGIDVFRRLLAEHPKDRLADDAQYLIGRTQQDRLNDFVAAAASYRKLLADFPDTEWASTAKGEIQEIEKEEIRLSVEKPFLPGEAPKVGLAARNVKTLAFTAYRLDIPALMREGYRFHEVDSVDLAKLTPFATWGVGTGVADDHKGVQKEIDVPVDSSGAFLIRAEGEASTCRTLLVISGVGMVVKKEADRVTIFGTDAATGEAAANVRYLVRAGWRLGPIWNYAFFEGTSGEDGLAEIALGDRDLPNDPRLEIVGTRRDDVALSVTSHRSRNDTRDYRLYTYTDRPVYRPGQTVHLKSIVRARGEGDYDVAAGTGVRVEIRNPRGENVFQKTLVTSDAGTITADLTIGEEPPLGAWQIRTFVGGREYYTYRWSGAQFRVEEYKKPEFEVTVDAGESRVKPGADVTAKVAAKYYFGAPVVHGEATWRVFRQPFRHFIPVHRRYGWYYRDLYPVPHSWYGRELVAEGSGLTDEEGHLTIGFPAKDYGDGMDSRYVIEVAVTDESRREIRGGATVYATEKPFFVRLEPRRFLYKPGDAVEVSIRAEDANGRGVASEGKLVLASRKDTVVEEDGEKKTVTEWVDMGSVPAKTREDGTGTAEMVVDSEGQFRLTYVSAGEDGTEVTGETFVWCVSREFAGSQYRFSGVQVLTDRDTYAIGDGIEVLVNSQVEDATILLTVEAGDRILAKKVVTAKGRSHLEKMTVGEGWTPNVYVKALTIRDGRVWMDRAQVIVPPVRKFLDVSIVPKKDGTYRPGEVGTFVVTTKDATGEPVSTDLSLVFFDESILYIQPDTTPDIREFFYGEKRGDGVRLSSSFDFRHGGTEKYKEGHELERYRQLGLPQPMNPWYYNFSGFAEDVSEEWGQGLATRSRRQSGARGGGAMPPGAPAEEAKAGAEMDRGEAEGGLLRESARKAELSDDAAPEPELAETEERAFFPDTAYWNPALVTGKDGKAEVTVTFPDSLTTWKAVARGATAETAVGSAEAEAVVTKNIVMRLAAPRFFRERDEVVVSGIVHNFFDVALPVRISVETDGGCLEMLDRGELSRPDQTITIAPGKEQRVDWWFRVVRPGRVTIRAAARTERESDAVKMGFPVLEHGVEKFTALAGALPGDGAAKRAEMTFVVPEDRHEESARLAVSVSPSLASSLLETLPFLADYPYGCVEQTMSRFLPTVVVKKTLLDLGYSLADLGIDPTREVPSGYWGRPETQKLKVLRDEELKAAVAAGVTRLADFQNGDGSWGWFKGSSADLMMTAYVTRGLVLAARAGADVPPELATRGASFLYGALKNTDPAERAEKGMTMSPDLLVAVAGALLDTTKANGEAKELLDRIVDWLWQNREKLGAVSRARLALCLSRLGEAEKAGIVCENLTDLATIDRENGTARFGRVSGYYRWYDDAVTGTAETLRAWLAVKPESDLVPMMVKWLVANRRGASWKSTMDTAHATLALCDYLRASGELDPDLTITVTIDDRVAKTMRVTRENLFTFDDTLGISGASLASGKHVVRIEREGRGNLYFEGSLTVYTREENVKGTGNEIRVARNFYRIHQGTKEVERKVWVKDHYETRTVTETTEEREPLAAGATIEVGDVIEVELVLTAKNDYHYLVFSDPKAAGLEPIELTSGHAWSGLLSYRELRDERTDLFVSTLPQGEHRVHYRVRAEIPGTFHTMPTEGFAMYLPDVRTISDEAILTVTDPASR